MIEEEFFLQECYSPDNEDDLLHAQDHLLQKFALFCGKLYIHRLKLESATITRRSLSSLGINCVTITGKVSGRAEDVAAMMIAHGTIA